MPELLKDIIALVFTPVVIIGVIAYFLKTVFSQWIQRERDRDLEQFKSLIRERELHASRLHEQHVLILSELFSLICKAREVIQAFVSTKNWSNEYTRSQAYQDVASKVRNAEQFFAKNRIWLSKKLCRQIQQILDTHGWKLLMKANFLQEMNQTGVRNAGVGEQWEKLWKQIQGEVPAALELLEEEFRQTLGVYGDNNENEDEA